MLDKGIKIGTVAVTILSVFFIVIVGVKFCVHIYDGWIYKSVKQGVSYMNTEDDPGKAYFALDQIGEYQAADFEVRMRKFCFEPIYSSILLVSYEADEYAAQKEKLLEKGVGIQEKIVKRWPEDQPLMQGRMDRWEIFVYDCEFDFSVEKTFCNEWVAGFALVGYDDDAKQIAYMKFYDASLDYINNKSLDHFIHREFDCEFMK